MYACSACGAPVAAPREVYRTTTCSGCGRDLKTCRNCRFYSPGAHWDCAETVDEPVREKERANFCTFFSFREGAPGAGTRPDASQKARRAVDKLFGDGS